MAEYNDRDWRLTGGELATVEYVMPKALEGWLPASFFRQQQFPHPFSSVEPPTKTTPIPLRALRHQRQVIGLITAAHG